MARIRIQKPKQAKNKRFNELVVLTGVFLAIFPSIFSSVGLDKFRLPKDIVAVLFTFLLVTLYLVLRGPRFQLPWGVWEKVALGFLAYSGIHCLLRMGTGASLDFWFLLLCFGLLFLLLREVPNSRQHIALWYGAAAGLSCNAVLTILQYYGLVSAFQTLSGETISGRLNPSGLIGDVNSGGFLFGLVSIILLYGIFAEKKSSLRWLALLFLAANLTGLLFTRTITAVLSFGLCLALWGVFHLWWMRKSSGPYKLKPVLLVPLLVVILAGGFLAASRSGLMERLASTWQLIERQEWTAATAGRFPVYLLTWRLIQEDPWIGRGLGTFARDFYRARSDSEYGRQLPFIDQPGAFQQAHNEYLQVWLELGGIGLVCFLFLLLAPLGKAAFEIGFRFEGAPPESIYWRAVLAISVLFVAVSCLTFFPFHLSSTGVFVVLLMAGLRRAAVEDNLEDQEVSDLQHGIVRWWNRYRLAGVSLVVAVALLVAVPQVQRWRANRNAGIAAFLLEQAVSTSASSRQARLFADEALDRLQRAQDQAPDFYEIYNLKGTALLLLGKFSQAAESYRKAAVHLPSPEVYTNLAAALIEQGSLDEAAENLRHALHYNPHYQRALNARTFLEKQQSP